jgi:predicted Zn-dependent peptidase
VFKNDTKFAVSLLADILQNPLLDQQAMEREREVIMQEVRCPLFFSFPPFECA